MVPRFSPDIRDAADAFRAGDADAFERLFTRSLGPLSRYAYGYVKSWEVAEDLVHDVFVQLWRRREEIVAIENLESYLYSCVRHDALDHLRHAGVEAHFRDAQEQTFADGVAGTSVPPEGETRLAEAEFEANVQRAIDALPPRQREIVLLRWRQEASYREIGEALGIGERTVETHLRRAIRQLKDKLPDLF